MKIVLNIIRKYISKRVTLFNSFITLISFLIALVSLLVAINSLFVSEKVYLFSSKDYQPEFEFEFIENGLNLVNKNTDLYAIEDINILKIEELGFFENDKSTYILVPFITTSYSEYVYDNSALNESYKINFSEASACAYICKFDETIFSQIQSKIKKECGIDSKKCFEAPSLEETYYLVDIGYSDKFNNYKNIRYKYVHSHGYGEWHKIKITDAEFDNILKQADVKKFSNFDEQWKYLENNYRKEF